MAGNSNSEAKTKQLLCLSYNAVSDGAPPAWFKNLQVLQILRKSGQIEKGDLLTFESECAISCNLGTLSHLQTNILEWRTANLGRSKENFAKFELHVFLRYTDRVRKAVIHKLLMN